MIYLTLHQTLSDYESLMLDNTNTPHIAYIVDTTVVYFTNLISLVPEGYQLYNVGDKTLMDSEGKRFCVKQ